MKEADIKCMGLQDSRKRAAGFNRPKVETSSVLHIKKKKFKKSNILKKGEKKIGA